MYFKNVKHLLCGGAIGVMVTCLVGCYDQIETKPYVADPSQPDSSPDSFSLILANSDIELVPDSEVELQPVTIAGIDTTVSIKVSGNIKYKIGVDASYTTSQSLVKLDDTVYFLVELPSGYSSVANGVVTIGDTQANIQLLTVPFVPATAPDAFIFSAQNVTEFSVEQAFISEQITLSGLNAALPVSVEGGQMQINGQPFTDQDGLFVEQGDTLRLAVQGLAQIGDVQTAMVTIGDADPVSFVVTAIADITPDAFSFAAKEVAVKANPTPVESATITISGLNTAANISVTGGEYKIDGGSYVSTGGQISNGQQVTVRTTPGAEIGDEQTVTLTIGTVSQDFIVTTIEDLVSTMAFPPPFSFTSEGTLKARAIAKAKAGIKTVTIQVLNASDELQSQHDATLESDGSYSAEVTLTDGDNYLRAIVTDSNDVTNQGDAPETVHLVKTTNSVSGAAFGIPSSAALHEASQTLFVGNRSGAPSEVVKVDLTTGVRTQVAVAASGSWGHLRGVAVHNDDLYVTSWQTDKINKLPVSHSDKSTALTDAFLWTNSGADTSFNLTTQEISVDLDGNRLLVPTKDQKRVFAFDLTTKAVSQLTDDDMGVAPEQVVLIPAKDSRPASFVVLSNWATTAVKDLYEMPYSGGVVTQWVDGSFTQPLVAAYDSKRDQLILVDDGDLATPNTIYSISLDGNKTVAAISDAAASLPIIWGEAIAVPSHSEFAYITDAGANNGLSTQGGVLAVDLQTGARVYITKE